MKLYEAIFIFESALAERDWDGCVAELNTTIEKHGGKIVDLRKWDDRRLVYEIDRAKRGMYVLVHFEAPGRNMEAMRRDLNLSERILRQLVVVDEDGVPTGDERPGITSTAIVDFPERRPREEGDRGERGDRGDRVDRGDRGGRGGRFREREEAVPGEATIE